MRFEVPQFIDVEDKIFGPFTFKQFLYLAGGAGTCYVLWHLLPGFLAILAIIPVAALAGALTFYRVNGKPFIQVIESWISFRLQSKLYLWKKEKTAPKTATPKEEAPIAVQAPKLSGSKLKDIAWSLDVLDLKESKKTSSLNIQ
jgi:hypothetical protein